MNTQLDLYFVYVAQFIYNRATHMIMTNSLQIYEISIRQKQYKNNTYLYVLSSDF